MKIKPKAGVILDEEEKEIQAAIERGEFKRMEGPEVEALKAKIESAARESVESKRKDKAINIRITAGDLRLAKEKAEHDGMPYQTLLSSVIHRFLIGDLVDRKSLDETISAVKIILAPSQIAEPAKEKKPEEPARRRPFEKEAL